MRRRQFLSGLTSYTALASAAWLTACAPTPPLTVAIYPWIGYETLYLADEFDWLPASVRLQQGRTASDSLAALQAGQVDAACLTLDEVLRVRATGMPLTVALVFDVSAGADIVLARPTIHRLADLAGKRIGFEQNALGALMFNKLLDAAQLPASALTPVDLPPDRQLAAWRNHEVDVVVTYEPFATLLQHEGAQHLFDTRQIPDTVFDVLAVRTDRAKDRQANLRALLVGHFRAIKHLRTNRLDAIYRIAAHQGIKPNEVQQALAGVVLPTLPTNRNYYLASHDARLTRAARTLSALMVQRGLLPREDTLEGLLTPDWLPREEE
ncbi:MAG: ABC transporter substrate-binding protein [Sterolibacterium sp.]